MYCSKPDTLDKENEDKEQEKEKETEKSVGRFWLQSKIFFETLTQPILNL